jgi:hypothetical protein
MPDHRLSSEQMARFCDEGYLRFDSIIPEDLCRRFQAECDERAYGEMQVDHAYHQPLERMLGGVWQDTALREILALPAVAGIVRSLVGTDPLYDHHVNHTTAPDNAMRRPGGNWFHQDHAVDLRPYTFDAVLSIFPHEVTKPMGGTIFVPGSHFRRPHDNNHYRYQHINGSMQAVCPAGTIFAWHGALWHSGRPNRSERTRTMFKLRLNPTAPQVGLWDTSDLATFDPWPIFRRGQPWMSNFLVEYMHRTRFWRYLTGDHAFDPDGAWTRMEIAFDADYADPRFGIPMGGAPHPGIAKHLAARAELAAARAAMRAKVDPRVPQHA